MGDICPQHWALILTQSLQSCACVVVREKAVRKHQLAAINSSPHTHKGKISLITAIGMDLRQQAWCPLCNLLPPPATSEFYDIFSEKTIYPFTNSKTSVCVVFKLDVGRALWKLSTFPEELSTFCL